jgi:plastocyanin
MRRTKANAALLLAPMAVAALVAGCGGGNDNKNASTPTSTTQSTSTSTTPTTPAAGKASTLKLSADPGGALKFTTTSLKAKAGKVTLVMSDPSSAGIQHGIAVEGNGVDKDGPTVSPGGKSTLTVDLKPGKYQFYCPVDGHKAAGMVGTLTVK